MDDVQKSLFFLASKKNIELKLELKSNLPRFLKGDPGRLRQVLLNLLSNAIKFNAKGFVISRVNVLSEDFKKTVLRFEIQDSGIGISADAFKNLFQPFNQADSSTQRRYGGTGLGLSICKRLVEHWEGKIGVESEQGKGSTFWFEITLPLAQKNIEVQAIKTSPISNQKKVRILIAEDNTVNQIIAIKMIQKMGFYADIAANGFEAVEAISIAPYDLILMDCQMPECDGYEATRIIRGLDSKFSKDVIIIAMTANAMSGDSQKCLEAGMDGYISKPVSYAKLEEKLNDFLVMRGKVQAL